MIVSKNDIELTSNELYSLFVTREIIDGFRCYGECDNCVLHSDDESCNLRFVSTVLDDIIGGVFND